MVTRHKNEGRNVKLVYKTSRNLLVCNTQKVLSSKYASVRKTVQFLFHIHRYYTQFCATLTRILETSKSTREVAHDILRTSDGFE